MANILLLLRPHVYLVSLLQTLLRNATSCFPTLSLRSSTFFWDIAIAILTSTFNSERSSLSYASHFTTMDTVKPRQRRTKVSLASPLASSKCHANHLSHASKQRSPSLPPIYHNSTIFRLYPRIRKPSSPESPASTLISTL